MAAEIRAAKGRKLEAKAEAKAEPAPEPTSEPKADYVPGMYTKQAEEMSAKLAAAKRAKVLDVLSGFAGSHKLEPYRA